MRLHSVRLVAAVTLFACAEASALKSQPEPTILETSGHGHTSDQTFPQNGTNTDEEERMNSSNAFRDIRETAALFKPMGSSSAIKAQQWKEKLQGKSAREAFTFFKLGKTGDNLFASSNFPRWKIFVADALGENSYLAMMEVLLDHFDNLCLVQILDAAKEAGNTKAIAIKLENAYISLCQHSSPGIEFDELGLRATNVDLLGIPLFETWYKSATKEWSPIKVVIFLRARSRDFGFAAMLDAAKEADSTNAIAIELEDAYISLWQRSDPDNKFDHLGLDAKSGALLGKPLFKTWYKFAKQKWSPEKVMMDLEFRSDHLSFAAMLDAAKDFDDSKAIAIELEDAWISVWQGCTAKFVFEHFDLNKMTRNALLGNPLFKIWYKFATQEWSPEEVMKFMRARFGDFDFAKMLEAAKKADNTNAIAIKLEKAYISLWQSSDLRIIFRHFSNFEFKSDSLIGDYYFKTWYKFATQEGSPHKVMIILRDQFGDLSFAKMLDAAKEADSTKAIAIELEDAYILSWQGNTADFMFNHFDLKATRSDLVGSPLFKTWYKFATQKWSPEEVIMFLEKRLNELGLVQMLDATKEADSTKAIAIELEDAYISLCQHSNPGIEFDELGLRATSDDLLGIPLFETWYKSATKEWSPIKVVIFLRARSRDFGFAAMLDAAKEADSTNAIAIELEDAYISLWQRSNPDNKFDHLGLDAKSDDLLGIPLFKTWYKFATQKWSPEKVIMYIGDMDAFDFARMLDAAKKADSTKAIAIELEDAWISPWPESQTVEIFDDLDLDAKSDDLLGNPLFKTWYKFATKEWSPLVVVKFLKGESDDFHYANMLDAATKVEDTEAIAIELLEALFDHWSQTGLSEAAVNEKMRPTRPISLLRKTELGQTVNVGDYSVWRKYLQWRYKNRIFDKAKDSTHAL